MKKLVLLPWCSSLSSSSVGYISKKNLPTFPPSFIEKKSINFVEWEYQVLTLFEEIRNEICSSSFEEGRRYGPSRPGAILIEIPTDSCV